MLGDVLRYVEQEEQRALGHDGAHDLRLRRCRGDAGEIQCEHVRLPAQMNALVEAVSAATSRLVVVLLAGSPCALP